MPDMAYRTMFDILERFLKDAGYRYVKCVCIAILSISVN